MPPTLTVGASGSGQQFILEHCMVSPNSIIFLTKIAGTMELRIGVTMYLVCRLPIGTRLSQAFPILAALSGKGWKCGGGERGREVTWVQGFVVVRMNN